MNTTKNYFDQFGEQWKITKKGKLKKPMKTNKTETSSGFTTYDTSQGHCGLCGRLDCNGGCFK